MGHRGFSLRMAQSGPGKKGLALGRARHGFLQLAGPSTTLMVVDRRRAMEQRRKQLALDADLNKAEPLEEIDRLIATAEARIERQREYVRCVAADFEGSMKAIADLDAMTSALVTLKKQRAQIVRWEREHIIAALGRSARTRTS